MPASYWVMIWFSVACMLASPVGYRLLSKHRETFSRGRWRLYAGLCLLLFLLGIALLIALGLQYPVTPRMFSSGYGGDSNRNVLLHLKGVLPCR